MKHFEDENNKYSLLKSSHNTFFLAARSFAILVALQLSLRYPKSDASVEKAKTRYCFAAVNSGGCCTIWLHNMNRISSSRRLILNCFPDSISFSFWTYFHASTWSGRLGVKTVQIMSASAEQLEQWLEQDPRLSSKPFGATTKASPQPCREITKAAVDASANTSMQYVVVNANKILLRSQMLI